METPTTEQVREKLKSGEIIGFETIKNVKFRLFISSDATGNILCYYGKGRSRKGYQLHEYLLKDFKRWLEVKKSSLNEHQQAYNTLFKYRKLASEATFTNRYIRDCLKIPDTYDKWVAEGKKDLYGYHCTTGTRIDGKVITLASIQKDYPYIVEAYLSAFYNNVQYSSGRFDFRGYDGSLSVSVDEDGNSFGHLAMEFRNCGNGYYYLFINDFKFIGYDID